VVVSSNPADWTPHVLDGKVAAIVQVGNRMVAGGSFTRINGVAQKSLVKLRLSDGARIAAFKGKTNARVKDMAVSGGRLYIGGTFKTADGVARSALAAVDPVTVTDWATTRYQQQCARVFDTYMCDIDISPDGSYFVVGTTGPYRAGSLCDSAARWETGATGGGQQPTWVDHTGGDTLYSVAITGTAVYVGGHQRGMNNSFTADRPAPARWPARASPPSTRSTACPCPGTPGATAAWAPSPWSPPPRAPGSAATPTASAATSTTAASPSCPWPAAPRSPSPGSGPCPATCSASAPTAP
jgi:hypothetical protein